jgi:Eph receptor B1
MMKNINECFYFFQIRYFVRSEANNNASVQSVVTTNTSMPFTGLKQRTEYGFQVRAKTTHGWGEFSPPIFKTTGQVLGTGIFPQFS